MVIYDLPFSPSTAQRLMAVARDDRLRKAAHGQLLPPSWRTLYELTRLTDLQFRRAIDIGAINPEMQRSVVYELSRTFEVTDPAEAKEMERSEAWLKGLDRNLRHAFGVSDAKTTEDDRDFTTGWQADVSAASERQLEADRGDWIANWLVDCLSEITPEREDAALLYVLARLKDSPNNLPLVCRAIDAFIPRLRAALAELGKTAKGHTPDE
jgi:hypothetical protein